MSTTTFNAPATRNPGWGFFGTMGDQADQAWPLAVQVVAQATGCDADAVVTFLDAATGRHFADSVLDQLHAGAALEAGIQAATGRWMAWRIGRDTARRHGIPRGLPYLTGWVAHHGIEAEAELG